MSYLTGSYVKFKRKDVGKKEGISALLPKHLISKINLS